MESGPVETVHVAKKPSSIVKVGQVILFLIVLWPTVALIQEAGKFAVGAWATQYCSGWNENTAHNTCTVQGVAEYADEFDGLMTIGSFTAGILFVIPSGLCGAVAFYWFMLWQKWRPRYNVLRHLALVVCGFSVLAGLIFSAPLAYFAFWIVKVMFMK